MKLPALDPGTVAPRIGTAYPEPFKKPCEQREKRALGNAVGITRYGVNLTRIAPGAWSAQRHWHTLQDEFIYMLEGELVLITDEGEQVLRPGMAAGFPAGKADGHHLVNRTDRPAVYLEIGDRTVGDEVHYPDVDLFVSQDLRFRHKSGEPW